MQRNTSSHKKVAYKKVKLEDIDLYKANDDTDISEHKSNAEKFDTDVSEYKSKAEKFAVSLIEFMSHHAFEQIS